MRSVGLDLGARHIAYCEVREGKVVDRVTRLKTIGVGQHKRKNDAIDAEHIALAVEAGRIPEAHVLSPERRELRKKLSVRQALVEVRAQYVVTIRGLARAEGTLLPSCSSHNFLDRLEATTLDDKTRLLIAPLTAVLKGVEEHLAHVDDELELIAKRDPLIRLCATAPGVGLIVAATFLSVIDDAKRFKSAHAVSAYLGLVPSESTTGGPSKRRLGSITKQGNPHARAMLVQAAWSILRGSRHHANDPLQLWGSHRQTSRLFHRCDCDRSTSRRNALGHVPRRHLLQPRRPGRRQWRRRPSAHAGRCRLCCRTRTRSKKDSPAHLAQPNFGGRLDVKIRPTRCASSALS
jgi:transposase